LLQLLLQSQHGLLFRLDPSLLLLHLCCCTLLLGMHIHGLLLLLQPMVFR
jgi:hypothetical protein